MPGFALSLPADCPLSRSHSAKVHQHYKSNVLFSKHWERECRHVKIIDKKKSRLHDRLRSKSAAFILDVHSGRRNHQNTGGAQAAGW